MSMNTYANGKYTVEQDFVENTCPDEMENLKEALDKADILMEDLGSSATYGNDIAGELAVNGFCDRNLAEEVIDAYNKLCKKFKEETGLDLSINYHRREEYYDEVDGAFWVVGNVIRYTEEAEKIKEHISFKSWVTVG